MQTLFIMKGPRQAEVVAILMTNHKAGGAISSHHLLGRHDEQLVQLHGSAHSVCHIWIDGVGAQPPVKVPCHPSISRLSKMLHELHSQYKPAAAGHCVRSQRHDTHISATQLPFVHVLR